MFRSCIPRPGRASEQPPRARTLVSTLLLVLVAAWPTSAQEPGLHLPSELSLRAPGTVALDEEQELQLAVTVVGGGPAVRVLVDGLPPGARWNEPTRTLSFRPDFIQGGARYTVDFTAVDGGLQARTRTVLDVRDTVRPPAPRVLQRTRLGGSVRLELEQSTDRWLDSPGHAGRTFPAVVTVPLAASTASRMPVVVRLHGVGNWPPPMRALTDQFLVEPSDPHLTYWWGYSERLPGAEASDGTVPAYTERRVLALLEWVLRAYPGADPERVFVEGDSMGGMGALAVGLLHARHFAGVHSSHGQTVAKAHRAARRSQLARLWGTPELDLADAEGMGVWTRLDLTRALRDEPEAREQHVTLVHGKDDPIIHFGAAVARSTLTGASFYGALQAEHVGHFAAWDEGGHMAADPWLGARWWTRDWNPRGDAVTFLRRDLAFPAFTRSSWDGRPGEGLGNGRRPWHADAGFAGDEKVAGDSGWDGDLTGTLNGGLRWDARRLVDSFARFEMPLRASRGPTDLGLPVVDVTPRRVRHFRCLPGEHIRWTFGPDTGTVTAQADGSVTVPDLRLREGWTVLVLERELSRAPSERLDGA
ncbi:alpha/beta hydrolase-fold protein [Myxococcaceae bacterium GXIMD 01537]